MAASILFYISGHGYGHARRMTQVIREVLNRRPDLEIQVRSAASARIFESLPSNHISHCDIDAGVAEKDPFTIDREASLNRLTAFMARRDAIIADEVTAVQRLAPSVIISDIPFLAGDVAAEVGLPCIGISNFTWDWIYANLFGDDPRYLAVADSLSASYAKMSLLLELPFGKTSPAIAKRIAVPLIAMRSHRESGEVMAQLGIASDDRRPRVLIGTRGSIDSQTLASAAHDANEFLFLCPREIGSVFPANCQGIELGRNLDFSDVLKISDVVVSKLGYGMISECIATQTRLVWPPRNGFAEDEIVAAQVPQYVPMLGMSSEDYHSGCWGDSLRKAMQLPAATRNIATNGAQACADFLLDYLSTKS